MINIEVIRRNIRKIISFRQHWIMEYKLGVNNTVCEETELRLQCVKDIVSMTDGTYSISLQKKIMDSNSEFCDVFVLVNTNSEKIGTISLMYKNGNELEYRIRECDAFIYNVYIEPKYRNRGYAKKMIALLWNYLSSEKDITTIRLAVSKDNLNAIKTYQSVGFNTIESKFFVRFLRRNFPYYKI